jgi:hypothetical protein
MSIRKRIAKVIAPIKQPEVHTLTPICCIECTHIDGLGICSIGGCGAPEEEPERDMVDLLDDWMTGKIDTF